MIILEIIYKNIKDLKPYSKNARKNDKAVKYVAKSIENFGFKVPVIIDKDDVIVCGHTRYKASKKLGYNEIPCIIADDLTEEQIKAFRLADNKVSEKADWDFDLLSDEINDIIDINMEDFGFEFIDYEKNKIDTQKKVEGILNLNKAKFNGVGKYDIPQIKPVKSIPEITEWIGFNYVLSDNKPSVNKGVHFFIDDYQFERVFKNPEKYIEKLSKYGCVLSPDFSPYSDMPMATQIFNHYRKHWCGRYFQENYVTVVPTVRASTDERSFEWFLDGEPKNGIIAYSSMWTKKDTATYDYSKKEWDLMIETLKPKKVLVYGEIFDFMNGVEIEQIETFTKTMRKRINNNE